MSGCWRGRHLTVEVLFSRTGLATQISVEFPEGVLLFDCGDGTVRDLVKVGTSFDRLLGVFITHGHPDHLGGLWALLGYLRALGRKKPFCVWYPQGSQEVSELLAAFRRAHAGSLPYPLSSQPVVAGQPVELGGAVIVGRRVHHRDSVAGEPLGEAPALGYRLSWRGEEVAYTGDTGPCEALPELVRGVDLALIEASWDEPGPEGMHLTLREAEELGGLARQAFLIHRQNGEIINLKRA